MAAAPTDKLYSTYKTFLMQGTGSGTLTYAKLCDIKTYPDMGGSPDMIDMTTLSNRSKIGVPGIQNNDAMQFTLNYNPTVYSTLHALADGNAYHFAIYFGGSENVSTGVVTPTGDDGKFTFDAMLDVFVSGKGVNEGREMTLTLTPTTDIAFDAPT